MVANRRRQEEKIRLLLRAASFPVAGFIVGFLSVNVLDALGYFPMSPPNVMLMHFSNTPLFAFFFGIVGGVIGIQLAVASYYSSAAVVWGICGTLATAILFTIFRLWFDLTPFGLIAATPFFAVSGHLMQSNIRPRKKRR